MIFLIFLISVGLMEYILFHAEEATGQASNSQAGNRSLAGGIEIRPAKPSTSDSGSYR